MVLRFSSVARLVVLAVSTLAAALAAPGIVAAHGGPPITRLVALHPTDPDVLLLQTSYGLLRTGDGGNTWSWTCPQVMDWDLGEDPEFLVLGDGSVLGALFGGLVRGEPDLCGWGGPPPGLDTVVIDLEPHPTEPLRALALTSAGGQVNGLWQTTDGGRTWSPAAELGEVLWERVRYAPSAPGTVWVSGGNPPRGDPSSPDFEPRTAWVWRSDDGGQTFDPANRRAVDLRPEDRVVQLLAVDPTDPDRLYLRVSARDADDSLRRSDDGGRTWVTLRTLPTLRSFTVSGDGRTLWVSGLDAGVARSTDGGDTWEVLDPDLDALCLAWRADGLLVCGRVPVDPFGLARSPAGHLGDLETVYARPRLSGPAPCPAGGDVAETCGPWVADLCEDVALSAPWCPSEPVDGGTAAAPAEDGGCRAAGRAPAPGLGGLAVLLGAMILGRARRRQPGSSPPA